MKNIILTKGSLKAVLCAPDAENGYYRGTRFDYMGVFRQIVSDDFVYADEWFDNHNPYAHDAVCGPSEEFAECGYDDVQAGDVFLKPGVGLLYKEDAAPYDHFRLYKIAGQGKITVSEKDDEAVFTQVLEGGGWAYVYEKTVKLTASDTIEIRHTLKNTGEKVIEGDSYNHAFFTFVPAVPGPEIEIDFPFEPCGHWRSEYDSVALSETGIRFSRNLERGESVFMGDLKPSDGSEITGLVYTQKAPGHAVHFYADQAFHRIAFWSNHRVACVEPFIPYRILPGEEYSLNYKLVFEKA